MTLIKFNKNLFPWNTGLTDFMERDDFFNDDFYNLERSLPAMNVTEHPENFEIELASPGFEKKDFEITLKDHVLEVAANKDETLESQEKEFTRKEFNYRSFRRSLQLPNTIDASKEVKATYKNGILKLTLPKMEAAKQKAKKVIAVN
ncbi:Hsp20/alpha crystallin family protein [Arenibacter sp. GZD96]|uniref:Hsp20/alpha crystallin family protein n=1 Tax=Aurantibrevibacter litoralis TaxID=3106030 RepID=UPI002AFFE0C3|nr:Hsp20/alpha crystallin family protein [Arenibacter sp. GZD-96]MEA1785194.1 Hsp20/alpha crystallin family protein [Arenibacter sp. GZD-96]